MSSGKFGDVLSMLEVDTSVSNLCSRMRDDGGLVYRTISAHEHIFKA